MDALGEDIRELLRRRDPKQTEVSELDGLVRKVLANVDVLGTFSPADDIVAPLDTRSVVLVDRRISCRRKGHGGEKLTKVDYLDSGARSRIVLSLSS